MFKSPEMIQESMDEKLKTIKEARQLKTVQLLFQLLPRENFRLLEQVLTLLNNVSQKEESKMTAETLGTLFAPCILAPRKVFLAITFILLVDDFFFHDVTSLQLSTMLLTIKNNSFETKVIAYYIEFLMEIGTKMYGRFRQFSDGSK